MERGREHPPDSSACPVPRPAPRVAHAPMSRRNARGSSLQSACRMHADCHVGTRRRSQAKRDALSNVLLNDDSHQKSAITTIRIELCSTSSRLSLRSTLRASALTTPPPQRAGLRASGTPEPARSSKSSTHVMADEARPHFCVDRMRQQSYREDLVDAIGHPSVVSPDAEH